MKLAEALAERSDCQTRLEDLKNRKERSARVQEGEQPSEDTSELQPAAQCISGLGYKNPGTQQVTILEESRSRVGTWVRMAKTASHESKYPLHSRPRIASADHSRTGPQASRR